jgi:hypothetical protein
LISTVSKKLGAMNWNLNWAELGAMSM